MAIYFLCVLGVAGFMIGASALLGQRHKDRATGEPYESGIVSAGSARLRFTSRFYLIAMLFVIFDLEAVFIFAWAVVVREAGWAGYISILVFILLLAVALVYLWRVGALESGPSRGHRSRIAREGCLKSNEISK
jgi:NADH-quinone oxidoreductase subunit A